jgi:AraC-like DNA-binding protein
MISPLPDIRTLFRPLQPTTRGAEGQVSYREALPDQHLRNWIYCYWELKTLAPLASAFHYRVVADGCMDIFFETSDPGRPYIMGFSSSYTEFPLPGVFHYTGVRFLPGAFPLLYGIKAAELTNRFEELHHVVPLLSKAMATLNPVSTDLDDITSLFDLLFLKALNNPARTPDHRFYEAMELILRARGTAQLNQDLGTGISPRQLRRLFDDYIGDSPKTFSKIVRFQHILQAKPSAESLRKNKIFFNAGYYDQAHFIKEFKMLFGNTPAAAFR